MNLMVDHKKKFISLFNETACYHRINKSLRGAQGEVKNAFQHQYGGNSELSIALRTNT